MKNIYESKLSYDKLNSKLSNDIEDCDDCPLYGYDCTGGVTSNSAGMLIEPPCCYWKDGEEIYRGMYAERSEISYDREYDSYREELESNPKEKMYKRIDELENQIKEVSNYDNVKTEPGRELSEYWTCPRCGRQTSTCGTCNIIKYKDIETMYCRICNTRMAHTYELEDLLKRVN